MTFGSSPFMLDFLCMNTGKLGGGLALPVIDSGNTRETSLGGVPREQKMLKRHLSRVIHHQVC